MKKSTGIKIIKRGNPGDTPAPETNAKKSVFAGKRAERELADRVGGWVKDFRERRRGEEIANLRRFLGVVARNAT
jgi:hypothetical protein